MAAMLHYMVLAPHVLVCLSQEGSKENLSPGQGDGKARLLPEAGSRRQHKRMLAAVTDQRFRVTMPTRPGRVAAPEVHRYDRMILASPPDSSASGQGRP